MMIVDTTCGPWYSVTLWSNLSGFWRRVWMSCWTFTQFFTLSHRSSSSIMLNSPQSGPTTYYTFSTNTLLQSQNFFFNFDEISFSEQAYFFLLCFPKSYRFFTLYSSNVHKLIPVQCVLEYFLRDLSHIFLAGQCSYERIAKL